MAVKSPTTAASETGDAIVLRDGHDVAVIALKGAELQRLELAGRPIIWTGDPDWWGYTAPLLFPVVGRLNGGMIRINGRQHPMDMHGFARNSRFTLIEEAASSARLLLTESAATLVEFPAPFRLEVLFRMSAGKLEIGFEVGAGLQAGLDYALGFHPAFPWPAVEAGRNRCIIEFEQEEVPKVETFSDAGLFTGRRRPLATLRGRRILLADFLFEGAKALCFLDARSRWLELRNGEGQVVRLTFENFPHLAIWAKPGGPFVSLEGWTGHGDLEGFDGELSAKPSMLHLQPGETRLHRVVLEVRS